MRKRLIILIFLVLAGTAALYLLVRDNSNRIEVVMPVRGPVVQAVYATGTVEPSVMIPIAPKQTARLMTLLADEGSRVQKDQILGEFEDLDLRKSLVEQQAKADLARRQYARSAELLRRKAQSQEEFDRAKSELESANAAAERTQAQLSYLKLTAPEAGTIIRRDGEPGETITAGDPVFWMSCCAPLRISAEVDEEDISLVSPGQRVAISADAFPGRIFDGKVISITPKGDPVSRSYRVRIGLDDTTPLMIGMTAETNIITRKNDSALLVPAGAVENGKIRIIREDRVTFLPVKTGTETSNAIEIVSGIGENELVIKDANLELEEGARVSTISKEWKYR